MKWLEKYADHAYALMRIVTGFLFLVRGVQKILGVIANVPTPVASQLWLFAGIIELLGGLAVMLGFQTRVAAFLCSGFMAVSFFWRFHIGNLFFRALNIGEFAALYCFVFLFIACRGGVKWSVDKTK